MFDTDKNYLFSQETMAELMVPKLMFRRIQKRDGTLVNFDKQKITDAIFAAAQSVGGKDERLAESLSDHVILYLARTYADGLLNVEQVQDAIEKVLIENGHARTAKSFILYRAERTRMRQASQVSSTKYQVPEPVPKSEFGTSSFVLGTSLQVRTSDDSVIAWNRQRIIDALVRETQLDVQLAAKISREVELQIIDSNLRVITAGLIRELVNAKLLEYGLEKERKMHARLGIPLYDFERLLLTRTTPAENTLQQTLAAAMYRQYSLAKVFSSELVDAHAQGDIYLHNLDRVINGYELRIFAPETVAQLSKLIALKLASRYRLRIPFADSFTSRAIILVEHPTELDWELLVTEQDLIADFKLRITDLKLKKLYLRLKKDLSTVPPEFVLHKVTLNLPRLAYQAEKEESEPYLFQLLNNRLQLIAQAHLQKQFLLNRIYGSRLHDLVATVAPAPMFTFAIGVLGLNELVQSFYGEQLHQSEPARRLGLKILAYLSNQCQQLSQTYNRTFRLEPTEDAEISYRFAKLDLERYPGLATPVVKRKPTNGGVYYTLGARFADETSHELFLRIIAESQLHAYLNQQAYATIPATILPEYNGLFPLLKKMFHETSCQLLLIDYAT